MIMFYNYLVSINAHMISELLSYAKKVLDK